MNAIANIKTITKRELGAYFASPLAYVFIVIFLLLCGFFTFMVGTRMGTFFEHGQASLDTFFIWHPWFYLFLVPAVGMRLWAEERRVGTLELLLTMPITSWQAIVGKFLASWLFLALALVADVSTGHHGELPWPPGQRRDFLRLRRQLADGRRVSRRQLHHVGHDPVAGGELHRLGRVVPLSAAGRLFAGHPVSVRLGQPAVVVQTVAACSVITHFENFQKGVLDSRDVIFFLSLIVFSLFTTAVILRGHRK